MSAGTQINCIHETIDPNLGVSRFFSWRDSDNNLHFASFRDTQQQQKICKILAANGFEFKTEEGLSLHAQQSLFKKMLFGCSVGYIKKPIQTSQCASCGYEWRTGQSGSHSCSEKLQIHVFKLNVLLREALEVINEQKNKQLVGRIYTALNGGGVEP